MTSVGRAVATLAVSALACAVAGFTGTRLSRGASGDGWTAEQIATLRSLSLLARGDVPADPSNRYADDPRAASLGKLLFFDPRLSGNGKVSCASCHLPARQFQDGLPRGRGVGATARRTMAIADAAYSPWFFWDGRADSQWSQALGPLENPAEHGGTRALYAGVIARAYAARYTESFGELPSLTHVPRNAGPLGDSAARAAWEALSPATRDSVTRVFANVGKAIAAYERTIHYGPSRFDRYVARVAGKTGAMGRGSDSLSARELRGLRLFLGDGKCVRCHSGPLLADNEFHNVGIGGVINTGPDSGRAVGIRQALAGEFNCTGRYSDAKSTDCGELRFAPTEGDALLQAFRTPTLRDVAERAPYGHTGEFRTLASVLDHYNRAPAAAIGQTEVEPLHLTPAQLADLAAFLRTLNGPIVVGAAVPTATAK